MNNSQSLLYFLVFDGDNCEEILKIRDKFKNATEENLLKLFMLRKKLVCELYF